MSFNNKIKQIKRDNYNTKPTNIEPWVNPFLRLSDNEIYNKLITSGASSSETGPGYHWLSTPKRVFSFDCHNRDDCASEAGKTAVEWPVMPRQQQGSGGADETAQTSCRVDAIICWFEAACLSSSSSPGEGGDAGFNSPIISSGPGPASTGIQRDHHWGQMAHFIHSGDPEEGGGLVCRSGGQDVVHAWASFTERGMSLDTVTVKRQPTKGGD